MEQESVNEWMLRSCLSSNFEDVLKYSKKWDDSIDIEFIDFRGMRLAPYFLDNLTKHNITSKHQKRLKVLRQYWWLKTKFLQDQLQTVCNKLAANEILPMVFKGGSLMYYYNEQVLRPMADIDIFVPYSHISTALEVLKEIGYKCTPADKETLTKMPKLSKDFRHAVTLKNEELNVELDLHWRIGACLSDKLSQLVYNKKEKHPEIENAWHPSIIHELLILILHAETSNSRDNLNWILDSYIIKDRITPNDLEVLKSLAKDECKLNHFNNGILKLKKLNVNFNIKQQENIKEKKIYLNVYDRDVVGPENILQRAIRKSRNSWRSVKMVFPNNNIFNNVYQFLRIVYFQYLNMK